MFERFQDKVGKILVLLLICVSRAFDEEQPVAVDGRHVAVDETEKTNRVAIGKIVVGANQKCPGVGEVFHLAEIGLWRGVDIIQQSTEKPVVGSSYLTFHPSHQREREHVGSPSGGETAVHIVALGGGHTAGHIIQIGWAEQEEMLHSPVVDRREVMDDLVGTQRMPGQHYVTIALLLGIVDIGGYIIDGVGKTLVPRPYGFRGASEDIEGGDSAKGIARLGIEEVDAGSGEGVADRVIERVGIEIAVDARDSYQHCVGMRSTPLGSVHSSVTSRGLALKERGIKHYATFGHYFQFFHCGCKITAISEYRYTDNFRSRRHMSGKKRIFALKNMYNKKIAIDTKCGFRVAMEVMGGKWKPYIIYELASGPRRPAELMRAMPHEANERVLTQQLKELVEYGVVERRVADPFGRHSEYSLTKLGNSLIPIIEQVRDWGESFRPRLEEIIQQKRND